MRAAFPRGPDRAAELPQSDLLFKDLRPALVLNARNLILIFAKWENFKFHVSDTSPGECR